MLPPSMLLRLTVLRSWELVLGKYEGVARTKAAVVSGLVQIGKLLRTLLGLNATLEFNMLSLKATFGVVCLKNPGLNKSPYNIQIWRGVRAERTLALCNHLRRLARDSIRRKQCLGKCSGSEATDLQESIGIVSLQDVVLEGVKRRPEERPGSSAKAFRKEDREVAGSSTIREARGHLQVVAVEGKGQGRELKGQLARRPCKLWPGEEEACK